MTKRNNLYRRIGVLFVGGIAFSVASGCANNPDAGNADGEQIDGPSLAIAVEQPVTGGWDPTQWTFLQYSQVSQAAYESLLHATVEGDFSPGLATDWGFESALEFRMSLREGVTFSDGEAFDAAAVKANLEYGKASDGRGAALVQAVDSVDVVDEYEVVIHLSTPVPDLELILSQNMGMMVSPAALGKPADLVNAPVGAGPYVFDAAESIEDYSYVFTKNPDYWDADNVEFSELTFRVMSDAQAAFSALQAGEVNLSWATQLDADAAESAGINVYESAGPTVAGQFVDLNGELNPGLADERVRQAINYAINREAIAENVIMGSPTSQMFSPESDSFVDALDDAYPYDPERAKQLLVEAGYADGFTFAVGSVAAHQVPLQAVAEDLAAVGVTLEMELPQLAEFVPAAISGKFPAVFAPVSFASPSLDFQNFISTEGSKNTRKYEDADLIAALDDSAFLELEERTVEYQKINTVLTEEAWFFPVVRMNAYYFYDETVGGLERPVGHPLPTIRTLHPSSE